MIKKAIERQNSSHKCGYFQASYKTCQYFQFQKLVPIFITTNTTCCRIRSQGGAALLTKTRQ